MKKLSKIVLLLFVVLFMSGCVKYNVDIKISNNKKMDMSFISAVSSSLKGQGTETTEENDDAIEKLKSEGWKVEEYKDDTYEGYKLTKSFANIDDLSSSNETVVNLNEFGQEGKLANVLFQKKEEGGKTVYYANFKFSISDSDASTEDAEGEQDNQMQEMVKQMMKTMDLKFTVEVPKVLSSNATTTDGNKLTWDLTKMEEGKNIEFSFTVNNSSFPVIPVAIGVGVLVIIVLVVVLSKKGKKEETPIYTEESITPEVSSTPATAEEVQSVAPAMPEAPVEPIQNIEEENSNNQVDNNL